MKKKPIKETGKRIMVWMYRDDIMRMLQKCNALGVTMSTWIRMLIMKEIKRG
jgi:hypothetical protein